MDNIEEVGGGVKLWVRCTQPFKDRETGDRRAVGDEWETGYRRARKLARGLVNIIDGPGGALVLGADNDPWWLLEGRDLRTVPEDPAGWRVVACLNIWEDADSLRKTLPTWYEHVDRVIAVDGAYAGAPTGVCASTDGTLELLSCFEKVEVVPAPEEGFWKDQVAKRNAYMERLEPGDLAFVVDADEFVEGAEYLRHLGPLEVGWVPYRKGIYVKEQNFPRLYDARINPRYTGRHYWVEGDRGPITDCQTGGSGYDHVWVPLRINNTRGKSMRSHARNSARNVIMMSQVERESKAGEETQAGRESLRIVQISHLDAGMVVFRLHTAINSTTPHTSIMGVRPHERPWNAPRQYDLSGDRDALRMALASCDVVHCHLSYQAMDQLGVDVRAPVVMHHHGTMYRRSPERRNQQDARRADVRLVSNLELLQYGDDLHYLPNPVPVVRYRALRERVYEPDPDGYLRVGHSPSKRELKGTEDFLKAVDRLRAKGYKVRPILIEDMSHEQCLYHKARYCDVFFDSFWLGMQCSGIEAGAMGIPVIAGDPDVAAAFRDHWPVREDQTERSSHDTPYAYANTENDLYGAIANMYGNPRWRVSMGLRIQRYVTNHHDYAAVTSRYLDILDEVLGWRDRLALFNQSFLLTKKR